MGSYNEAKYGQEFRAWQQRFYNSKTWKELRHEVRRENRMICSCCHKLIRGKSIVDHIKEITPDNKDDENITLYKGNLQLLCIECHNNKTFSEPMDFELKRRGNVNLF
jgi:5-methylcytosine-specific restriction endonuclease McrA